MALWPRSRTARRRLTVLAAVAPVLALAAGLTLYGLRNSISYFYTPAQARAAHVGAGRAIQLGGLVAVGSVAKSPDGATRFVVTDRAASAAVVYRGDLPDLFREGQGVVAMGSFDPTGVFVATTILAKHDERYMPAELARALKARGEWRGAGAPAPAYAAGAGRS
ncbi:MAG TPA: cytochrome c maturation protein CcmE [Caulobacteraceae bacterium]|jgi:cytochrome c-type biogenesis protein CcmE|nr:cytochrome c maturation protein CcmE [Caulobacteraceae bacterium]